MGKIIEILFGIGVLCCLTLLPSYIFYVFVGQYLQPLLGITQKTAFTAINGAFVLLILTIIFYSERRGRKLH